MPKTLEDLAFPSVCISVFALMVSLAWNSLISTAFDSYAEGIGKQDGREELKARFIYAVVVTILGMYIIPRCFKKYRKKSN